MPRFKGDAGGVPKWEMPSKHRGRTAFTCSCGAQESLRPTASCYYGIGLRLLGWLQLMASRGETSLGFKLARILRERIRAGDYAERVPTENELMAEFAMSRYAVRSAMLRLERDGQIDRHPGRGTRVVSRGTDGASWAIRTVEDLIDRNLLDQPKILSARPVPAHHHPEAAKLFGLGPRARIFLIERVSRGRAGSPSFFSLNFMPVEVGLALPARRIGREPLIVQIERLRKIRAHRVRQDISGGVASGEVTRHLDVAPGFPTVVVRRTYFGWDGDTIVTAELHYRLEAFRQAIDLFRENIASP